MFFGGIQLPLVVKRVWDLIRIIKKNNNETTVRTTVRLNAVNNEL